MSSVVSWEDDKATVSQIFYTKGFRVGTNLDIYLRPVPINL